jgi:hypothetical protein
MNHRFIAANTAKGVVVDASTYLLTVHELSARNTVAKKTAETIKPVAPFPFSVIYLPYAPYLLVGILFLGALCVQIISKIHSAKQLISALVLALFAASIPAALTYIQNGVQRETMAGPQTDPKMLSVLYTPPVTVVITWQTDVPTVGAVRYWTGITDVNHAKIVLSNNQQPTTNHTITLSSVHTNTAYLFEVLSDAKWFGSTNAPLMFHTPEL